MSSSTAFTDPSLHYEETTTSNIYQIDNSDTQPTINVSAASPLSPTFSSLVSRHTIKMESRGSGLSLWVARRNIGQVLEVWVRIRRMRVAKVRRRLLISEGLLEIVFAFAVCMYILPSQYLANCATWENTIGPGGKDIQTYTCGKSTDPQAKSVLHKRDSSLSAPRNIST